MNRNCGQHIYRTLFCRLTPELSRPVAGRQTRASVAQKHAADATTRGRLGRIVMRPRSARRSKNVSELCWRRQSGAGNHSMERRWLAARTCHRSPERRPSGAQTVRCEWLHQADTFRSEQLTGALSRRKASGANVELTEASCAWLWNSVKTDEAAVVVNPHNPLLDRA